MTISRLPQNTSYRIGSERTNVWITAAGDYRLAEARRTLQESGQRYQEQMWTMTAICKSTPQSLQVATSCLPN